MTALPSGAEATALPSGAPHTLTAWQQGAGAREKQVSTAPPSRAETGACVRYSFYLLYWSERERGMDVAVLWRGDWCVRALGTRFFYLLY